jgi:hypothetical protein
MGNLKEKGGNREQAKSEIRISKSETNPKQKIQRLKTMRFEFSSFDFRFVSDFDIRILCFVLHLAPSA